MIVIYGIKENLNPVKAKLSEVLQQRMYEELGFPHEKRAYRFIPMAKKVFISKKVVAMLIP